MRRLRATTVSYGIEFFADIGFHATVTVMAVYYVQEVGLNPLELVLLGTIFEATIFVFGLATGFAIALGAYMVARLARRITEPLYLTWLNRNIEAV